MSDLNLGEWFRFDLDGQPYIVETDGWPNLIVRETAGMIETRTCGALPLAEYAARLAARVAELEGEKEKLLACVKAGDGVRDQIRPYILDRDPSLRAYDAARAALDAKGDGEEPKP